MLRLDARWPQDIGAIAILDGEGLLDADGRLRVEVLRKAIGARLHGAPRFRQLIHHPGRFQGGPVWVDAPVVDLDHHVRVLPLPPGSGEAQLLDAVEKLRARRLDPSRPQWEMWFLPGLPGRRVGLFVRWQHALADGRAAMSLLAAFLDPAPDTVVPPVAWAPAPTPTTAELLVDNVRRRVRRLAVVLKTLTRPRATARRVRGALPMVRETLAQQPGPETSLNRVVGPGRRFALLRTTLEQVHQIAAAHGATVNDVLLAVTAGGLRALLSARGEPVGSVPVYVPVSLRRGGQGGTEGNLISQMVVPLPLGIADPDSRLRRIAQETARRKSVARPSLGTLFRSRWISRPMLRAVNRQRVNVETGNVAGPARPVYLAGARLLEVFPVLNLIGSVGLGVGALSYAGAFEICVTADRDACPDLDVFVDGARAELDDLAARASQNRR
ncbi:WS/DGAT/MGAT family acyltransferase [Georgenia soli]|uniref:Diacylglycerol O-acyltransferase n=2 Tax=Georgenia soli TaxID=638953 RepID=A0A2A9EH65_9MICO|nr:WS/DGAT/MGAT family acyltransferase [Georgenia soli]